MSTYREAAFELTNGMPTVSIMQWFGEGTDADLRAELTERGMNVFLDLNHLRRLMIEEHPEIAERLTPSELSALNVAPEFMAMSEMLDVPEMTPELNHMLNEKSEPDWLSGDAQWGEQHGSLDDLPGVQGFYPY